MPRNEFGHLEHADLLLATKYNFQRVIGVDHPRRRMIRSAQRSAAAASRLADRRKSIVAPVESTARYKYTHLPLTRM